MECGSSLTACSAHGSTPGQFFCPGAKHSFCCKEHCCYLTSFDGRIIAQKSDFVNRYYRKRGKKQEMGNGKLAQGCQSGVVGGRRPRRPMGHCRFAQAIVKMGNAEVWGVAALSERPAQGNSTAGGRWCTTEPPDVSLRGGRRPTWRPEREARGSALGVQSREGSYVFAGAFLLSIPLLRDCHVASLLAMTHQGNAVVHQRPPAVELFRTRRSQPARGTPHP